MVYEKKNNLKSLINLTPPSSHVYEDDNCVIVFHEVLSVAWQDIYFGVGTARFCENDC